MQLFQKTPFFITLLFIFFSLSSVHASNTDVVRAADVALQFSGLELMIHIKRFSTAVEQLKACAQDKSSIDFLQRGDNAQLKQLREVLKDLASASRACQEAQIFPEINLMLEVMRIFLVFEPFCRIPRYLTLQSTRSYFITAHCAVEALAKKAKSLRPRQEVEFNASYNQFSQALHSQDWSKKKGYF